MRLGPRLPNERIELAPKEQVVYDEFVRYYKEHQKAPTYQYVADRLGCTRVSVYHWVTTLYNKGWVTYEYKVRRSVMPLTELIPDLPPPLPNEHPNSWRNAEARKAKKEALVAEIAQVMDEALTGPSSEDNS